EFTDDFFRRGLRRWLRKGSLRHRTDHVINWDDVSPPRDERRLGKSLARQLKRGKAIMGVFDEGCMGMCNAILPDDLLQPTGLDDLLPAGELAEGMLNNRDRPPVRSRDGARVLYEGEPLPHFNEVDECAGLDALLTYRVHRALGQPVENTLHDIRWGDIDRSGTVKDYVWVFEISGSVPPAHLIGGWAGATGERQPPMYFQLG